MSPLLSQICPALVEHAESRISDFVSSPSATKSNQDMSSSTFDATFSSWLGTEAQDSLHSEGSGPFPLTTCPNSAPGIWESLHSATVWTFSLLLPTIAGDT